MSEFRRKQFGKLFKRRFGRYTASDHAYYFGFEESRMMLDDFFDKIEKDARFKFCLNPYEE